MILESEFQKFEEDHVHHSAFKELLIQRKKNFDKSPMTSETRSKLVPLFKSAYQRTGLAKLPQLIELMDILLENGISFIVVCYHQIVLKALSAALEKRKVPFIDISTFFIKCKEEKNN
jgi:hypothetical protein